jgi:hypothetical protein
MALERNNHVGKPPFFDGNNYDYWKTRMTAHLKAMGRKIWKIVIEGYVILDEESMTKQDEENELLNDQAINVLYSALDIGEFNRVKRLESAHGIWEKLEEIDEGSNTVKESKLYIFKSKFSEFAMNKDEDVPTMFNRLNDIVNELKCLGFIVPDEEFSQKFLRSLQEKYDTIITLLVRSGLKTMTPTQILGEVITLDLFKKSQVEAQANELDKKSIALKAKASKEESDDDDDEESDEEMALFVRRFRRMMSKRKFNKKGQSSKKNPFEDRKCYECGEPGHSAINCPSKKNKKYGKKKIEDKKKNTLRKRRMDKPTLWSGIPMRAPMMKMTSHQVLLPGLLSKKLHLSSPNIIASWPRVNLR